MSSNNLRIAIVGGGVCGLTCAIGLMREGVDVHVYEAAVSVIMMFVSSELTICEG